MKLTQQLKKALAAKAHHLNPVVILGSKGLTDSVQAEIERALFDHELIKIRISGGDRETRKQDTQLICERHQAELVTHIGHIIVIYRPRPNES